MKAAPSPLEKQLATLLDRRRSESRLRALKAVPSDSVDFSSNDFLSLSTNPEFRQAYLTELSHHSFKVGSTGSRLLDGNSAYAEDLEETIAKFHGSQTALLTNSGFDANVSLFSCLPQPGDIVLYDELIHASVHDGMRQSRGAKCISFRHNSIQDLKRLLRGLSSVKSNIFIAVESVYSMDGDLAPLAEVVALSHSLFHTNRPYIIVDEAHATGVYGADGQGLVSALGLEQQIFVRLHTFGKALGCNGAAILCSDVTRLYLINYARPLIYTTFMSFPQLAAIKVAYTFLRSGITVSMSQNLFLLIQLLHDRLRQLPQTNMITTGNECPQSPIFALLSPKPRDLAAYCQQAGFVVRAVVPPTVPEGTERVRVCLHAGNTEEQVIRFVEVVGKWLTMAAAKTVQDERGHVHTQIASKL